MMKLDTSHVAGFEGSTVVLEFDHDAHEPHHMLYAAAYERCYGRPHRGVRGGGRQPAGRVLGEAVGAR